MHVRALVGASAPHYKASCEWCLHWLGCVRVYIQPSFEACLTSMLVTARVQNSLVNTASLCVTCCVSCCTVMGRLLNCLFHPMSPSIVNFAQLRVSLLTSMESCSRSDCFLCLIYACTVFSCCLLQSSVVHLLSTLFCAHFYILSMHFHA